MVFRSPSHSSAPEDEQHRERGLRDRVHLLTGVEAALRSRPPSEPARVVDVEALELAACLKESAAIAREAHDE